jgi:amidase
MAERLRELGHEVAECDPRLPRSTYAAIDARYYHGIAEDAATLPRPELLEARTRSVARLGRALGPLPALAPRTERAAAAGLDELHRRFDVLLFPGTVKGPGRIGERHGRGALSTGWVDTARVAFQPLWNLVGRPALMMPGGFDRDGLPVGVQLGGRPDDETTLLRLAAQLEATGAWPLGEPSLGGRAVAPQGVQVTPG